MSNIKIEESNIPQNYRRAVQQYPGKDVPTECIPDVYRYIVDGLAMAAQAKRDKDKPVAVCIMENKVPIFGIVVTYIPGEDEDHASWTPIWSFNEADLQGDDVITYTTDDPEIDAFLASAASIYSLQIYPSSEASYLLQRIAVNTLKAYLDDNASPSEVMSVEVEGKFTAEVEIKDGIKEFIFVASEDLNAKVKNDGDLIR